jgi:hypothetical protein
VNEEQWLSATTPSDGLDYLCSDGHYRRTGLSLNRRKAGRRKLRLFLCACARHVWELVPVGPCREAVELGERLCEGEDVAKRIAALPNGWLDSGPLSHRHAAYAATACVETNIRWAASVGAQSAARAAGWALEEAEGGEKMHTYDRGIAEEEQAQAALLSDVFGNPFRPAGLVPAWRTGEAVALARGMYESRDFSALPILADALQDARCEDEQLLGHCRDPGPHVRGCWVVDLILSKDR